MMGRKKWVAARAACSVENEFLGLFALVEHDVRDANELDAEVRSGYTFEAKKYSQRFVVKTVKESDGDLRDQRFVTFEKQDEGICVFSGVLKNQDKLGPTLEFLVVPTWDAKNGRCELLIEDVLHERWQISQRALAGLFSFSWMEPETNAG